MFQHTLQEFRHPPPLSSVPFGGFHFQVHSKETEGLPPVEKSPTSSTLGFLCRLGSAWNSRVTKFSTSRGVEAYTWVRPVIRVSIAEPLASGLAVEEACRGGEAGCACRMIKVKVKRISSSLVSFRISPGAERGLFGGSGSYEGGFRSQYLAMSRVRSDGVRRRGGRR